MPDWDVFALFALPAPVAYVSPSSTELPARWRMGLGCDAMAQLVCGMT